MKWNEPQPHDGIIRENQFASFSQSSVTNRRKITSKTRKADWEKKYAWFIAKLFTCNYSTLFIDCRCNNTCTSHFVDKPQDRKSDKVNQFIISLGQLNFINNFYWINYVQMQLSFLPPNRLTRFLRFGQLQSSAMRIPVRFHFCPHVCANGLTRDYSLAPADTVIVSWSGCPFRWKMPKHGTWL